MIKNLITKLKQYLRYCKEQSIRHISSSYFRSCYRNLAKTRSDITVQDCGTCSHAMGCITWHCDVQGNVDSTRCKWESCYVQDEITNADLLAGNWIYVTPPKEED